MQTTQTTITRDSYGALYVAASTTDVDRAAYLDALALVADAENAGKIPVAYDDMEWGISGKERGKRIGEARRHEIYDYTPRAVLVCARSVEGTRYGQKTTLKEYFVVARHGRGVKVTPANKALAAKAAKAAGPILGAAIAIVLGKSKYGAPANKIRTGYKMVERDESGKLISVWDKSAWDLGKTRIEAATPDHRGGYYYYASIEEAINAAAANETFGDARNHRRLVVVEVKASGRHYQYHSEHGIKLCATRITPVREVAMTI
jgi:hypothetical protein